MKNKSSRMIMVIVLLGYFIILVDSSLVYTCSNEIGASFGMNTQAATWISNAYALTFGSLLLLGGRLGDIYGRKIIFIIGLALFGLSSLSVGLAPNAFFLIGARAVQGIGAAIIAPATLAIIMNNFSGAKQNHEISVYGMMSGVGVSAGLIIGAGITTIASWRWGFLINVPLCLILILLTWHYIPQKNSKKAKIDYLGAMLSFLATILLINGINGVGPKLLSLIAGFILLLLFLFLDRKRKQPILPLVVFASKIRSLSFLIRFIYSGAITAFWFFTPRILQVNYHFTPILVGLSFLPMTIVNFFSARLVDDWSHRYGNRLMLFIGLIIATVGFACFLFLQKRSNYWLMVAVPMIIVGFGQGLVLSPITNLAVENLSPTDAGAGSGVVNIMLQIGGVTALAILSIVSISSDQLVAFHKQIIGIALLSFASLLLSVSLLRLKKK